MINLKCFRNLCALWSYNSLRMNYFCSIIKCNYSSSNKNLTNNINEHLSHLDSNDNFNMINVSDKSSTERVAKAFGKVIMTNSLIQLIKKNEVHKGNVLKIAQLAGIMAAKKTSDLIPLCHNIALNYIEVNLIINDFENAIEIYSNVISNGKTGVEMEALTSVSVAALTIYDMCKSFSHKIIISEIKLLFKSGGKLYYELESKI